jgi:hypothetical protein
MAEKDAVDAAETIIEGAAEVVEGVADMARGFSGLALSGAFLFGAGVGGVVGYILCQRRLDTKYAKIASEEIALMTQHYADKAAALENAQTKTNLEEIIRERGYTAEPEPTQPPMAVTPPAAVVEAVAEAETEVPKVETRNIFEAATDRADVDGTFVWDWDKEKRRRSPVRPYVIHIDEREETRDYDVVTFTYYEGDDVVSNERDDVVDEEDRERLLGEDNLERFGHGSGDPTVVYIRNDELRMVFEVIRSPNAYATEVHGFEVDPPPSELRHSHRRHFDDE